MSITDLTARERDFLRDFPGTGQEALAEIQNLRARAARFPDAPQFVRESWAALWAWEHYEEFRQEAVTATERSEQVRLRNHAVLVRDAHQR